jgi:hypothetical protein
VKPDISEPFKKLGINIRVKFGGYYALTRVGDYELIN